MRQVSHIVTSHYIAPLRSQRKKRKSHLTKGERDVTSVMTGMFSEGVEVTQAQRRY